MPALAVALACGLVCVKVRDVIIYNATPSMPVGFYVRSDLPLSANAIVTVRARDVARGYATSRGFSDDDDRFIKRIAASPGDLVCAHGTSVSINGALIGERAARDRVGQLLPWWRGCRRLADDEYFLLGDASDSFDSRYWGPVPRALIEGVWRPL